jgi:hypothetical protein
MSLLMGNIEPNQFPFDDFTGPSHRCFHCGTAVGKGIVIHWSGHEYAIYMHPDCVVGLSQGLLMDYEIAIQKPIYDRASQKAFISDVAQGNIELEEAGNAEGRDGINRLIAEEGNG